MSHIYTTWAWEVPAPPLQKLILLALADLSNHDGKCWPGLKAIASQCSLSLSCIKENLIQLIEHGLILRINKKDSNGRDLASTYILNIENKSYPQDEETYIQCMGVAARRPPVAAKKGFSFSPSQVSPPPSSTPPTPSSSSPSSHTFPKNAIPRARIVFTYNADHEESAQKLNLNIEMEYASFMDYCLAHGKLYKNYDAAFRNWLRKASEYKQQTGRQSHGTVRQQAASEHWRASTQGLRKKIF